MWGWLSRLFSSAAPTPGPAAAVSRPREPEAAAAGAPPVHAEADSAGTGPRRALLGRNGCVQGFEVGLSEAVARRLQQRPDGAAAVAHHAALLVSAGTRVGGGRFGLVYLPPVLLERDAVLAAMPAGAWVWTDRPDDWSATARKTLRSRGVRLGAADGPPVASPPLDFVVARAAAGGTDTLVLSAQRWHEAQPRLAMVALGLQNLDDMERVLRAGFVLAGGRIGRSEAPARPRARPLGSAAHRICELINHLALDRDTAVITQAVTGDVTLTYRLLRFANSPAIGLNRGVETIEQAVLVLGRAELQRWLAVMLLSAAESRQASRALQEAALARGRLLESLARRQGRPDATALFTLGLFSLIEPLLQVPLADALGPLRLGDDTAAALLRREGPLAPALDMLDALDAADTEALERAGAPWGDDGSLPVLQDEAWRWAAEVTATSQA